MLRRFAPFAALLLLTACVPAPLPGLSLHRPAMQIQSTQGALDLIEQMAHAAPQDFDRIEAAFGVEINKSTRPSLKKILAKAAQAMHEHPVADPDPRKHPVARLVRLASWRYNWLMGENLISRAFEMFNLIYAKPSEQPALLQSFETKIRNTPKLDVQILLKGFEDGHHDDLTPPGSPLRQQLETILKKRLAA